MKQIAYIILFLWAQVANAQRVYQVAVSGNDHNPGTKARPLRSIDAAAQLAMPGDRVIVHAGTYREWVRPLHSGTAFKRISYEAAPGETVWIKGSEVVRGWVKQPDGNWTVQLPDHFFGSYNPYRDTLAGDWFFPMGKVFHTGQVYLNGRALKELADWHCSQEQDTTVITANFDKANPNKQLTEINVRPACFYPEKTGVNYITVKGFHLAQAATQWAAPTAEQIGLIGTNWSKGWIIEDNYISDSRCVGITLGKDRASGENVWSKDMSQDGAVLYNAMVRTVIAEGWNKANIGSHLVRRNVIRNCGEAGICGSFGAIFSKILDNDIQDIYTDRSYYGAEMAGIKFHAAIDVLIKGNHVSHAFIGIWLDWMAQGTRISGNLLSNNDYVDFFPEVDHGPYLVDNNQFLSAHAIKDFSEGGAYVHNLVVGTVACAPQDRITPWFQPHSTMLAGEDLVKGGDDRFYNNIFVKGTSIADPPKMHPWDAPDDNMGWGLACYTKTARPVVQGGNMFEPSTKHVKAITALMLGKAAVSGQDYTFMGGIVTGFNLDYYGKRRSGAYVLPGPFAVQQTNKKSI